MSDPDGSDHDLLVTYLKDRGAPCPGCGYDLRNLTSDRCPECGQQLVLGVHLAEPKLAAFIGGLVGLAMSAGFSWLLCLFAITVERPVAGVWGAILVPGVVSTILLVVWIKMRSWLRLGSSSLRITAVSICWCVPLANIIFFINAVH